MRIVLATLVAISLAISVAAARAADVRLYTENFPPYNYQTDDGAIAGPAADKVRAIMEEAGLQYEMRLLPWPRSHREAMVDDKALLFGMFRTKKRETKYDWLSAVAQPDFYLFARSDDNRRVTLDAIRQGFFTAVCAETDASCDILRQAGFTNQTLFRSGGAGLSETIMVRYRRADLYLGDINHHPFRMKMLGLPEAASKPALKLVSETELYLVAGFHVSEHLRKRVKVASSRLEQSRKSQQ